jgi:hypothetical protein
MKQNLKLNLSVYELPKNARELLYNGYSLDESDQHLGADIGDILDGIAEERFPGGINPRRGSVL